MARNSRNKKDLIKTTAAFLFRRFSYSATSMDMLASGLGANKATLYYYYESKSHILYDVVTSGLQSLSDGIASISEPLSPDDYLRALIRISVQQTIQHPNEVTVYFQESPWLDQALTSPQMTEVRRHERGFKDALDRAIAVGQSSSHYGDVEQVPVRYFIVGMLGYLPTWYQTGGNLSLAQVADQFTNVLLDGLILPNHS